MLCTTKVNKNTLRYTLLLINSHTINLEHMRKKRIINTLLASPIPTDRQIQQDIKAFIVRPNLIACPLVLKCKVNAARKSKVDDNTAKMQSIKQLGV